MRHLAISFLFKLKQIVCRNSIYSFNTDDHVLKFLSIRHLLRSHGTALPFVFFELHNVAVKALRIVKTVPPPLHLINVKDAAPSRVGLVTPISAIFQDSALMFGKTYLNPRGPFRKCTMATSDSGLRKN